MAVLAIAACNPVFGIDETRGPDSDGDGLSDNEDNCRLVVNADQGNRDDDTLGDVCDPCDGPQTGHDTDADGLDDACDACPEGSNHDEDGDGALDGCDVCPGVADAGEDGDGDGIGDLCDADPSAPNTRVFFDGFGPPRRGWATWFDPEWVGVGDDFQPPMIDFNGTWNFDADAGAAPGWWMEAEVVTPPLEDGEQFGLHVRSRPDGQKIMSCYAGAPNGDVWLPNYEDTPVLTFGVVTRFRIRWLGDTAVECMIDGQVVGTDPADHAPGSTFVPSLLAGYGAKFRWIDVVRSP